MGRGERCSEERRALSKVSNLERASTNDLTYVK